MLFEEYKGKPLSKLYFLDRAESIGSFFKRTPIKVRSKTGCCKVSDLFVNQESVYINNNCLIFINGLSYSLCIPIS